MEHDEDGMLLMNVDECDLFRPQGFTTVALAHNDEIGRLCAIRKLDQSTKARRMFFLEFYNTINAPHIILEWKYLSRELALETVIWFGNYAIVGCSDGSLMMFSPFKNDPKKFVICASPIVAAATISASQIVIASESSEVKLLEFDAHAKEFTTKKTIKFGSEQRVVSLAASLQLSCVAVGLIDSIVLIQVPSGHQSTITVSQNANKSTVIWSLLFVDDVLFSGDSRGKLMIHNPKTCALIKIITTHQADILSLVYGNGRVYVAGTDYRIQTLDQVKSTNKKAEWATTQQQIFHENDIRCMARVRNWLVSGGAEHQIFVSDMPFIYNAVSQPRCSVTDDGKLIVMPYLDHLKIWKRPSSSAETQKYADISVFTPASGPKLALKMRFWKNVVLFEAIVTPDGRHLVVLLNEGISVYRLHLSEAEKLSAQNIFAVPAKEESPITAIYATNSALYFAHGSAALERVDFETLTRRVVAVRQSDTMLIKIAVNASDENCLALTARSELLHIDLKATDIDEEERFEKLKIPDVPTDFKFHLTKEGDPMAVLVVSGVHSKLILLNLKTNEEVRAPIKLHCCIGKQVVSGASSIVENSIVLQETRGKCCVVRELNEVQSFAFFLHNKKMPKAKQPRKRAADGTKRMSDKEADEPPVDKSDSGEEPEEPSQNEITKQDRPGKGSNQYFKPMLPDFPREPHFFVDESGKLSIVHISSQPAEPPTSVPVGIRRFGR